MRLPSKRVSSCAPAQNGYLLNFRLFSIDRQCPICVNENPTWTVWDGTIMTTVSEKYFFNALGRSKQKITKARKRRMFQRKYLAVRFPSRIKNSKNSFRIGCTEILFSGLLVFVPYGWFNLELEEKRYSFKIYIYYRSDRSHCENKSWESSGSSLVTMFQNWTFLFYPLMLSRRLMLLYQIILLIQHFFLFLFVVLKVYLWGVLRQAKRE